MKRIAMMFLFLVALQCVASRWLPTRDNSDRLDKLREMLRDILESEYEKSLYNKQTIYKRDVGPSLDAPSEVLNQIQSYDSTQNHHP